MNTETGERFLLPSCPAANGDGSQIDQGTTSIVPFGNTTPISSPNTKAGEINLKVTWEFWRMAGRQSDYHYRGAPDEIDLGEMF